MDQKTFRKIMADPISRRQFLGGAGMLAGLLVAREMPVFANDKYGIPSDPFTLGVASGDPMPTGIVLWTRLAPGDPTQGPWNSARSVVVNWEVARDENLSQIVQRGSVLAQPANAHAVHVELNNLQPGTTYYYRFRAGTYVSPVGRTRTAPAPGTNTNRLKFAFCSCSDYQNGYFAAYRAMAAEDLDFWIHLGDYIYEYGPSSPFPDRNHTTPEAGPAASQLTTLTDYRNRHAQYKTDPHLKELHRLHPVIAVWDDHEVENNYADEIDEEPGTSPSDFLLQRAAAYRAYYEHMPLRRSSMPVGPDMQLYRRLRFGQLLELNVLDTRQYRTDQVVLGPPLPIGDFSVILPPNPGGTLLGDVQENWLLGGLYASSARWNVLAQQVMMARFNYDAFNVAVGADLWNMDQWDGYSTARQRLLDFMANRPRRNYVVLTGDIHSAWANELKRDFTNPASQTVAVELICTSITADFPPGFWPVVEASRLRQPWVKYLDARRRGYVLCTVTPSQWQADFRVVTTDPATGQVVDPNAAVSTAKTVVIPHLDPRIVG